MQQNSKLYGSQFIQSVFGQEHLNYDEFRDHQQGWANKYGFGSFLFSPTLKSGKLQLNDSAKIR